MDIEGAERAVLLEGPRDWLPRVRALQIEVHREARDKLREMERVLETAGLDCRRDTRHECTLIATARTP